MFKKYFIPGEHNNHQPHILRRRAILAILLAVLLAEGLFLLQIFLVSPLTDIFSAVIPDVLVDLTNGDRQQNNLGWLSTDNLLEKAAALKAQDMAAKSYFSHNSPDGKTPWFWLDQVGYNYQWAGENLAVNFSDSKDIEKAWMNSDGHRANILNVNFTQIGIAAASGIYKGQPAIFVVQFFGQPAAAKAPAVAPPAPIEQTKDILSTPKPSIAKTSAPSPIAIASQEPQLVIIKESATSSLAIAGTVEGIKNNQSEIEKGKSPIVTFVKKIIGMPKTTLNYFYLMIVALVLLALSLKIFVRVKIQHPRLIFNGILVLFVVVSIYYLNYLIISSGIIF